MWSTLAHDWGDVTRGNALGDTLNAPTVHPRVCLPFKAIRPSGRMVIQFRENCKAALKVLI